MSKIDDGGPAFPNVDSDERVGVYVGDRGMTIRDFFAASAIPALCVPGATPDDVAIAAFKIADAMIFSRKVGSSGS